MPGPYLSRTFLMGNLKKLKKQAKTDLENLRLILRREKKIKNPDVTQKARELAKAVELELKKGEEDSLDKAVEQLEDYMEDNLNQYMPSSLGEISKALTIAVMLALTIRWFTIEPFKIPTGSMVPTLLIGDQLLVDKLAYGVDLFVPMINPEKKFSSEELQKKGAIRWKVKIGGTQVAVMAKKIWTRKIPERGDIVVFRYPKDPSTDYIKRVIGVPGDVISMSSERLYINGTKLEESFSEIYKGPTGKHGCDKFELYEEEIVKDGENVVHPILRCQGLYEYKRYSNFHDITVPDAMLFVMGDNRDRSADSREWGFVPVSHLKGKALLIHLPLDQNHTFKPRWERFFKIIK
jgi:signal peptidase I